MTERGIIIALGGALSVQLSSVLLGAATTRTSSSRPMRKSIVIRKQESVVERSGSMTWCGRCVREDRRAFPQSSPAENVIRLVSAQLNVRVRKQWRKTHRGRSTDVGKSDTVR